jgi:hypothetical protein
MQTVYQIIMEDVAPKIAEMFRGDPRVTDMADPVVMVDVDDNGYKVHAFERFEVVDTMPDLVPLLAELEKKPPHDDSIAVVVTYKGDGLLLKVPDPRIHPDRPPWTCPPDEDP